MQAVVPASTGSTPRVRRGGVLPSCRPNRGLLSLLVAFTLLERLKGLDVFEVLSPTGHALHRYQMFG
jgi:hypothetical protein